MVRRGEGGGGGAIMAFPDGPDSALDRPLESSMGQGFRQNVPMGSQSGARFEGTP